MTRNTLWKITDGLIVLASMASPTVFAQQGARILRINDGAGAGQCIQQTDRLTVTLRGATLEKQSSWLGLITDTELGVTMTTTVSGSSGDETKSASFAKVVKESVSQYKKGQISLAEEQSLLSKFDLTNGNNIFSVVDLDVGIVRTKGKSVGAKILLGAVDATKSLSLPKDPFTSAYSVATSYVNSVFSPLLDEAAANKEATSAHITMNIDAARCKGDDEFTGTKAIIFAAAEAAKPGYVDINRLDEYCWNAELLPTVSLSVAPKTVGATCDHATGFLPLQNSYLSFYVNAIPAQPLKPNTSAIAALPVAGGEAIGGESISGVVDALRHMGMASSSATLFAPALKSNLPASEVGSAFGISERAVQKYRDALRRCEANSQALKSCGT